MEDLSEGGRGFRQRKKPTEVIRCPICEITIKPTEINQHYELEVDRLIKLQLNQKIKKNLTNGSSGYHEPLPGCSSNGDDSNGCPWVTFQKIRNNRHLRLRIKTRKRKIDDPVCPICNERPTNDINLHVEMCLKKNENNEKINGGNSTSDGEESIDIENESFEEYEWAGQKRVRASTFLEGGYAAAGLGTTISNVTAEDDDEEDLNVDGDDTQIFGPSQYTERNVIVPLSGDCEKEINENIYLRQLVTGQDMSQQLQGESTKNISLENNSNDPSNNSYTEKDSNSDMTIKSETTSTSNKENVNHVLESLKAKLREYEIKKSNKYKCLICMDEFHNPAVSICCWHVHCEECWLRTLGARKLCPQCNMITSPTDLRRIYM